MQALTANLEGELARRGGAEWKRCDRGRARRFVSFCPKAAATFARNRPMLKALSERYRLGIVSNFYGNLEAVCESAGLCSFSGVWWTVIALVPRSPIRRSFAPRSTALHAQPEDDRVYRQFIAPRSRRRAAHGHALHLDCAAGRPGPKRDAGEQQAVTDLRDLTKILQ